MGEPIEVTESCSRKVIRYRGSNEKRNMRKVIDGIIKESMKGYWEKGREREWMEEIYGCKNLVGIVWRE